MDAPKFKDFPLSYRLSQKAMIAATATLAFSSKLAMGKWPPFAQVVLATVVGFIVVVALVAASYVVIRYPFLSLVHASDGDVFSQQFKSKSLLRVAKVTALLTVTSLFVSLVFLCLSKANVGPGAICSLVYFTFLLGFTLFLCFFYEADRHPTVATFIRSTLGIGIVLAPLFLPVLAIGSLRCRRLLFSAMEQRFDDL